MNLSELVTLFRNSGFNIYKKGEYYFHNRGLVNYSFPLLQTININQELIDSLKWKYLITAIRTESVKKNTYEYILKTNDYSIERFKPKVRKRIIKSLNAFTFKRPGLEDLIHFGLKINRQALKIQNNRTDKTLTNHNKWLKQVTSFYNNKDVIILGAYESDRMFGYIITYEFGGKYFNHLRYYDREMACSSPMQGLMYTLINQILKEKGSIEISDGMESYKYQPELRRFKLNMLFERIPATRVYLIHPVVLKFIELIFSFSFRILKQKNFESSFFRTLVQFYQGHRNLPNRI